MVRIYKNAGMIVIDRGKNQTKRFPATASWHYESLSGNITIYRDEKCFLETTAWNSIGNRQGHGFSSMDSLLNYLDSLALSTEDNTSELSQQIEKLNSNIASIIIGGCTIRADISIMPAQAAPGEEQKESPQPGDAV